MLERYLDSFTTYAESVYDTYTDNVEAPRISHDDEERRVLPQSEGDFHPSQGFPMQNVLHQNIDSARLRQRQDVAAEARLQSLNSPKGKLEAGASSRGQENGKGGGSQDSEWQQTNEREYQRREEERAQSGVYYTDAGGQIRSYRYPEKSYGTETVTEDRELHQSPERGLMLTRTSLYSGSKTEIRNLIYDVPIPSQLLSMVPHSQPLGREFTQSRYSALDCSPDEFGLRSFSLRPKIFRQPRQVEIMMSISLSESYSEHPCEAVALARTLESIIKCVRYLNTISNHLWTWGSTSWERFLVMIVSTHPISASVLVLLEKMGIYLPWRPPEQTPGDKDTGKCLPFPIFVDGRLVQAHCFEVR